LFAKIIAGNAEGITMKNRGKFLATILEVFAGRGALVLVALAVSSAYAEDSIKDDAKRAGHAAGSAVHEVGHEAKKVGKEIGEGAKNVGKGVGQGAKKVGKDVGHAAKEGADAVKEGGKEFGRAVKGEK